MVVRISTPQHSRTQFLMEKVPFYIETSKDMDIPWRTDPDAVTLLIVWPSMDPPVVQCGGPPQYLLGSRYLLTPFHYLGTLSTSTQFPLVVGKDHRHDHPWCCMSRRAYRGVGDVPDTLMHSPSTHAPQYLMHCCTPREPLSKGHRGDIGITGGIVLTIITLMATGRAYL